MEMSEFIRKILDDKDYREERAIAHNNYSLFMGKDNTISEQLFLELIKAIQKDEALLSIYSDIREHLIIRENLTDKVFNELVKLSKKSKYDWNFIDLCHADLIDSQKEYLKSLNLNDAYWY